MFRKTVLIVAIIASIAGAGTVYFDLGDSFVVSGNWNTVGPWQAGVHVTDAIDSNGNPTSVAYNCFDGFAMYNTGGETSVTAYPVNAGRDSFYLASADNYAKILIGGLTAGESYDFKFFGSRAASGPRALNITIGAQTVFHDSAYNKANVAVISGITADASGVVAIEVRLAPGSTFGYLGVIEINGNFAAPVPQPAGIFVAPWGLDSNPGTYAWPKATMQGAFDAVIAYKQANGLPDGGLEVYFRGGRYYFNATANASASISGEPGKPVTFKPYNGEEVLFDGSQPLNSSGFSLVTDQSALDRLGSGAAGNVYQADIGDPVLRQRLADAFAVVDLDGKMAQVSRYPNIGNVHIKAVLDIGEVYTAGRTPGDPPTYSMDEPIGPEFTIKETDAARWQTEYETVKKARLLGYLSNDWYKESNTIASINAGAVKLLAYTRYNTVSTGARRFYVLNLMCELDSPGEWYFDEAANMLYVWPYEAITAQSNIGVWNGPEFIRVYCSNVNFEDFIIQGTSTGTAGSGMITFYAGDNTKFSGCTFRNTSRPAVSFMTNTASTNSGITGCDVYDASTHLNLYGGVANASQITGAGNYAINCHFTQVQSRDYAGAVNARGVGNIFRNNLVHNFLGDAIKPGGNDNIMELNEVFNCGVETGDGGATYWANAMWTYGNVFSQNFLHHIMCTPGLHPRGGMYPDQLDAGDTFERNVFYKAAHRAILINGGAAHRVEKNLFLEGFIGIYQTESYAQGAYNDIPLYDNGTLTRGDVGDYIWRTEQAVGVQGWNNEPWLSRYPMFALVMNQEMMRFWPIETYFIDNMFYGNLGSNFQYRYTSTNVTTNIDSTPSYIHKSGNRDITIDVFEDPSSLNFKFVENAPSWAPDIQFENIGLYIGDGRRKMPDKKTYRTLIRDRFASRPSYTTAAYNPATVNDLIYFNSGELLMGLSLSADLNSDGNVDLLDFAILGGDWLNETENFETEALFADGFESYSPAGTLSPLTGNINTTDAIAKGWYGNNFAANQRVILVNTHNSPWDTGGTQSAAIVRIADGTANPSLFNYFTDRTNLYNSPSNVNVTGSLGESLTSDGIGFTWDIFTPNFGGQPKWEIRSAGNILAIDMQVRFDTKFLRYNNGGVFIDYNQYAFVANTWYQFQVSNIDFANCKWDLDVFAWNQGSGQGDKVISLAGIGFADSVSDLDNFRMVSWATASHTFYLDNFQILAEAAVEPVYSPADINQDGIVDFDDLEIFLGQWLSY